MESWRDRIEKEISELKKEFSDSEDVRKADHLTLYHLINEVKKTSERVKINTAVMKWTAIIIGIGIAFFKLILEIKGG
jgi:hypothetical protein